jgi:hypothetical protein
MPKLFANIVAFLFTWATTLAIATEGRELAPEPTVSVGWVWFFLVVFVGICVWFGYAIWNADKKNRTQAIAAGEKVS